ncbi:hypothetical protein AA313_de0208535 [Arthrobotrys entomopaga]|nr:hypothetical protein AA313_de0208535 [Arthrobotrys entomopaga]
MTNHIFGAVHFTATISLLACSIFLILISLSGGIWRDFSILTVDLKDSSAFEVIHFSRDRDSYATYGTFGYCIQNIDLGQGYQKKACSDPKVGYPITEVQTAIDGTIFTAEDKKLDGLTKVMILHPISAVTFFLACVFSIRSGYVRTISSMLLTFLSWLLVCIAMAIDLYVFVVVHGHVASKKLGGGSRAIYGGALWCLIVTFCLATFAMVVMCVTVWQGKYYWRGMQVKDRRARKRGRVQRGVDGEMHSSESSPARRWSRNPNNDSQPFWRHRTDRDQEALVFQ